MALLLQKRDLGSLALELGAQALVGFALRLELLPQMSYFGTLFMELLPELVNGSFFFGDCGSVDLFAVGNTKIDNSNKVIIITFITQTKRQKNL